MECFVKFRVRHVYGSLRVGRFVGLIPQGLLHYQSSSRSNKIETVTSSRVFSSNIPQFHLPPPWLAILAIWSHQKLAPSLSITHHDSSLARVRSDKPDSDSRYTSLYSKDRIKHLLHWRTEKSKPINTNVHNRKFASLLTLHPSPSPCPKWKNQNAPSPPSPNSQQ